MTPYIIQIGLDLLAAVVIGALFVFIVRSLSEAFGLARSGRRPFDSLTLPAPGPESAPKDDLVTAGRR